MKQSVFTGCHDIQSGKQGVSKENNSDRLIYCSTAQNRVLKCMETFSKTRLDHLLYTTLGDSMTDAEVDGKLYSNLFLAHFWSMICMYMRQNLSV